MGEDLAKVERRVKSYWYRDGIGELAAGVTLILLGAFFFALEYFGEDSAIGAILQPSLVLVLLGLFALGRRMVEALKARLVYSRTGFVEFESTEPKLRHKLFAGLAGGLLAAAFAFTAAQLKPLQTVPALTGLVGAALLMLWQFKAAGLSRFTILAAFSIALGLWLGAGAFLEGYAISIYYAGMGLALAFSGGLVLQQYLRHNPQSR
jgi:hypothetical protein